MKHRITKVLAIAVAMCVGIAFAAAVVSFTIGKFNIKSVHGYKDAAWGSTTDAVEKALKVSLTPETGFEVNSNSFGLMSSIFYRLWDVPHVKAGDVNVAPDPQYVPADRLTFYTSSEDGTCMFYDGAFAAYYFGIANDSYESIYKQLSSKYGKHDGTKDFPNDLLFIFNLANMAKQNNINVREWDLGDTELYLVRYDLTAYGNPVSWSGVVYFSPDIFSRVKKDVKNSIVKEEQYKKELEKQMLQHDMNKLQ